MHCGTAARKQAECCRARQEGGLEQNLGAASLRGQDRLNVDGEFGEPYSLLGSGFCL